MKNISINKRKIFHFLFFVSLVLGVFGIAFPISFLGNNFTDITTRCIAIAFGLWAWLIIFGFFIKKKPLDWVIMVLLSIPHIILILVMYNYSHPLKDILLMYLSILSFWQIPRQLIWALKEFLS